MTDEFERGQAFGAYALETRLGGGGFGTVWRARETATGQLVALKILAGKFSAGETGRLRADVELLAAAASAGSEHVVRVLGGGAEPAPHVVMEFIEGSNLEDELDRQGKLSQAESLRILHGLAEALGVLHDAGIIHRDVKPANVMLSRDGTVKLTDFGIAKIAGYESVTATGQLPLSAAYAAPEVWAGEATYQSDFYALGAMAFQCLTGARPFAGNFVQLFEMHRNKEPDYALLPGEVVPALRRLIVECLRKEPASRPADAAAVLRLIEQAEDELARPAASAGIAPHEPRALGPWLIESRHPTQTWAFRCLHETSGEHATVEVHFSDSLELGDQLKRAVAANPSLVPLGAERLLGTNRLILRPAEAWADPPPGRFAFWVARQELPTPQRPRRVNDAEALDYARAALALVGAAAEAGLDFVPSLATTHLASEGTINANRVGLSGGPGTTILAWLRVALANSALFDGVRDDIGLAELVARKPEKTSEAAPGVAHAATAGSSSAVVDESALLSGSALVPPPTAPPVTNIWVSDLEPDSPPPDAAPSPPSPPSLGHRRTLAMWFGGGAAAIAAAVAVIWLALGVGEPPATCDAATSGCETPTPTLRLTPSPVPPTSPSSPTTTATTAPVPTPTATPPTSLTPPPTFTPAAAPSPTLPAPSKPAAASAVLYRFDREPSYLTWMHDGANVTGFHIYFYWKDCSSGQGDFYQVATVAATVREWVYGNRNDGPQGVCAGRGYVVTAFNEAGDSSYAWGVAAPR